MNLNIRTTFTSFCATSNPIQCNHVDAVKPNHTPKKCYIRDENGGTMFKDFGWKPIKLNLQTGMVDIKERWTKEVCIESFPLDYSTNLERILLEQGDKKVTSTLRKSQLKGHPLAMEMMKTNSEVVTEFKGIDSVTFVLGNKEASETDAETGDEVWKDVKSLRALLHDAKLPKKSGAGVTREAKVLANESYIKARIYYKAYFSNDVATDHHEKFDGKQYWTFPIKYLFQYNDIPNAVVVYEDVELRFFTDVRVAMDNKDWVWVKDQKGGWRKQPGGITTSVSRRKSESVKIMLPNNIDEPSIPIAPPQGVDHEPTILVVPPQEVDDKQPTQKELIDDVTVPSKVGCEDSISHFVCDESVPILPNSLDGSLSLVESLGGNVKQIDTAILDPKVDEMNILDPAQELKDKQATLCTESTTLIEPEYHATTNVTDTPVVIESLVESSRPDPDGFHMSDPILDQTVVLQNTTQLVETM